MKFVMWSGAAPAALAQWGEFPTEALVAAHAAANGLNWIEAGGGESRETHHVAAGPSIAPGPWPSDPSAAALKARLNALRKEAARVVRVEIGEGEAAREVAFDGESADLGPLAHIILGIQAGMIPDPFMFRGGGVSAPISHAEFLAAYPLAAAHVQLAYEAEGAISALIEDGTITEFAALEAAFAAAIA